MSFIQTHEREYNDNSEFQKRYQIFLKNQKIVETHDRVSFELKMNQFGDWTDEEFNHIQGLKFTPLTISNFEVN